MRYYSVKDIEMSAIADAIRAKTGKNDGMSVEDMPNEISEIESGIKTRLLC